MSYFVSSTVLALTVAALWSVSRYPQMPRAIFAYLASQAACTAVSTVSLRGMNPHSIEYLWLYSFPVTTVAVMAYYAATKLVQRHNRWWGLASFGLTLTAYLYLSQIYWQGVPAALTILLIQSTLLLSAGMMILLAVEKNPIVQFVYNLLGVLWIFQGIYKLGYSIGIVVDREFWRWTGQWFPTFLILAAYTFLLLWMSGVHGRLRHTWFGVPEYRAIPNVAYRKGHG